MKVVDANVFDPALSGMDSEREPVRLELLVEDVNLDKHSYIDTSGRAIVVHYGRLMKIYLDDEQEDVEDPYALAAEFNAEQVLTEPVFPVTVSLNGNFWQVYYMRLSHVQRILKELHLGEVEDISGYPEGKWELLPDPTWCRENKVAYYLQHSLHVPVRYFRDLMEEDEDAAENFRPSGKLVARPREIHPHRLMDMTDQEWGLHQRVAASTRVRSR